MTKMLKTLPLMIVLYLSASPASADSAQCHYETRTRTVMKTVTTYENRAIADTWCGFNAWGVYGCVPVTRWVTVPVVTQVPVTETYQVRICSSESDV